MAANRPPNGALMEVSDARIVHGVSGGVRTPPPATPVSLLPGPIPGPHLLLRIRLLLLSFPGGAAGALGPPLMAAAEALRRAVPLRPQSVLRPLTHVPVGRLRCGALGHCGPTMRGAATVTRM